MKDPINQSIDHGYNPIQPKQYIKYLSKNEDPLEKLTNRILKTSKYEEISRFKMVNDPYFNRKNINYFITYIQNHGIE